MGQCGTALRSGLAGCRCWNGWENIKEHSHPIKIQIQHSVTDFVEATPTTTPFYAVSATATYISWMLCSSFCGLKRLKPPTNAEGEWRRRGRNETSHSIVHCTIKGDSIAHYLQVWAIFCQIKFWLFSVVNLFPVPQYKSVGGRRGAEEKCSNSKSSSS